MIVLTHRQLRMLPRWMTNSIARWMPRSESGTVEAPKVLVAAICVAPVLFGGSFAIAHGVFGILHKSLELAGIVSVHYSSIWLSVDRTQGDLWEIFFYEPWFLAVGVCLLLSALQYARDTGTRPRVIGVVRGVIIALTIVILAFNTVAALIGETVDIGML